VKGEVVCFPVNSQNPKAPAWRVKKSLPREERQGGGGQSRRYEGHTGAPDDSEIPF
jgi:hypothetical protein